MGIEQLDRWVLPGYVKERLGILEKALPPFIFQMVVEELLKRNPEWRRPQKPKASEPRADVVELVRIPQKLGFSVQHDRRTGFYRVKNYFGVIVPFCDVATVKLKPEVEEFLFIGAYLLTPHHFRIFKEMILGQWGGARIESFPNGPGNALDFDQEFPDLEISATIKSRLENKPLTSDKIRLFLVDLVLTNPRMIKPGFDFPNDKMSFIGLAFATSAMEYLLGTLPAIAPDSDYLASLNLDNWVGDNTRKYYQKTLSLMQKYGSALVHRFNSLVVENLNVPPVVYLAPREDFASFWFADESAEISPPPPPIKVSVWQFEPQPKKEDPLSGTIDLLRQFYAANSYAQRSFYRFPKSPNLGSQPGPILGPSPLQAIIPAYFSGQPKGVTVRPDGVKEIQTFEIDSVCLPGPVKTVPGSPLPSPKVPAPDAGVFFAQVEKEIFAGTIAYSDLRSVFDGARRLYANSLAIAQGKISDPVEASRKVIDRLGQRYPNAFAIPSENRG